MAICNKADVPEGGLIFPDIPIAMVTNSLAISKDETWTYSGVDSLKEIRVGTVVGYTFKNEALNRYLLTADKHKVQRLGGDNVTERNLKKLLAGRIDAYIDDTNIITRSASQLGITDEIKFVGIIDSTPHYIGFTPGKQKSLRYAKILSQGMRELRSTGTLDAILAKYGMQDWVDEN